VSAAFEIHKATVNPQARRPEPASRRGPVCFAAVVVLSKREAFELCEACAEAERALLRSGRAVEAARMASVFELIEGRLMLSDGQAPSPPRDRQPSDSFSGSNSSESELTQ
jgi:hypothetical protein